MTFGIDTSNYIALSGVGHGKGTESKSVARLRVVLFFDWFSLHSALFTTFYVFKASPAHTINRKQMMYTRK